MSASDASTGGTGVRSELVLVALVVAAGLAVLLYISSQSQTALRKSAVGFDGLQLWLTAEGVDARSFTGGWTIDPDGIGLLVQPSFDPRPTKRREPATSKEELLMQEEEYDLRVATVLEKSREVTSLVILPKWRSGVRLTGLAHPILLNSESGPRYVVSHLLNENPVELKRIPEPFVDFDFRTTGETLTARLYVPQVYSSKKCTPIVGTTDAIVLGWCDGHDSGFYLLSDPDLFNNHGLRLADNAAIAAHFFSEAADGGDILIDYSTRFWFSSSEGAEGDTYERSWDDLKRFFGFPFLTLWLAGGLLLALTLWRATRRFGPLADAPDGPGSAKDLAIEARARLMRLTDQDGALIGDYAKARLAAIAVNLFGPAHGMDERMLDRQLAATFPDRHAALTETLAAIRALPATTTATDAIHHVNALEQILEQLDHETR